MLHFMFRLRFQLNAQMRCNQCKWQRLDLSKHKKVAMHSQARVSNATALTHTAHNVAEQQAKSWKLIDIESSTPSSISRRCKLRSNIYWLTEFCNSQCISHFAAFFIINWAKTFIAKTHFAVQLEVRNKMYKWKVQSHSSMKCLLLQAMPPSSKWTEPTKENHPQLTKSLEINVVRNVQMILPQVHLQKPCYDFSFL